MSREVERFEKIGLSTVAAPLRACAAMGGLRVVMTEALQFAPLMTQAVWPRRRATG